MKKTEHISAILAAITLAGSLCHAQTDYGLDFRSYETTPSERTSLSIPQAKSRLKFGSEVKLSFDFKIDERRENFGYLCRIAIDEERGMDIILTSRVGGMPYLVATDSKLKLVSLETRNLNQWESAEISLRLNGSRDSLLCCYGGVEISRSECQVRDRHSVRILFGGNSFGELSTTDVAPLSLKNIGLEIDGKHSFYWKLTGENEINSHNASRMLAVKNPEWMMDAFRKWKNVMEVREPGKMFQAVDRNSGTLYLISSGAIHRISLFPVISEEVFHFSEDIRSDRLTNDFSVLSDGSLAYIGIEDGIHLSRFDFAASKWESDVNLSRHSAYLHHSSFCNPVDGNLVQLFGYGFHQYLNERHVVDLKGRASSGIVDIPQRYLSSVGVTDSLAWIFGGKGNPTGIQELGAEVYSDLYAMDLRDYSIRYVCDIDNPDDEVASPDLIVDEKAGTVTGLFFCPNNYRTYLKLKQFSLSGGGMETIGDEIPYNFLDIESQSALVSGPDRSGYFASVITKNEDGSYSARLYAIRCPIIPEEEPIHSHSWIWIAVAVILLVMVLLWFNYRRRRRETLLRRKLQIPVSSLKDNSVGIHLLGSFRVIDSAGTDISSDFTPMMRQLLSLLVLYTENQKTISNVEMKEILWYDKSDESYFNNRGVQIKNLRAVLSRVDGSIVIRSENGNWSISMDNGLCDYCSCVRAFVNCLDSGLDKESVTLVNTLAAKGTLLPDMRYEWLDRFKSEYTDAAINGLTKASISGESLKNPELRISLADSILLFDSLDEEALLMKCRSLMELKRSGMAKSVFTKFTTDYANVMGENYPRSFSEFVKG